LCTLKGNWRSTCGTPLVVTPEQVKQQLAVIVACHNQNPLSRMAFED
jgi:hypothetical protein